MIINSYNLSRTFLAFGTLITLLFNSNYTLFGLDVTHLNNTLFDYNLFFLLKDNLFLAKTLSILVLSLVISGYYPRITGVLHWYVTFSFFLSSTVIDGGDHIATNLTLLLIPLTFLDTRSNHWSKINIKSETKKILFKSFYLLIAIQVCVIYLHSFIGKLGVEEWKNGTAVYYWFTHNHFGVNEYVLPLTTKILSNKFIVTFMTWGTLLLEFILAASIILNQNDKKRYKLLLIGIIFHFSIIVVHGLVSFFFVMTSALILYLLPFQKHYTLKQICISV